MKQRTLTVLYAIVLQQFYKRIILSKYKYYQIGICPTIYQCWDFDLINEFEFNKVFNHFEKQRASKHYYNTRYWWNPYYREIRIKFLESMITKTKRK